MFPRVDFEDSSQNKNEASQPNHPINSQHKRVISFNLLASDVSSFGSRSTTNMIQTLGCYAKILSFPFFNQQFSIPSSVSGHLWNAKFLFCVYFISTKTPKGNIELSLLLVLQPLAVTFAGIYCTVQYALPVSSGRVSSSVVAPDGLSYSLSSTICLSASKKYEQKPAMAVVGPPMLFLEEKKERPCQEIHLNLAAVGYNTFLSKH